jgi:HPt (histidine-containing phosphotransfer) domain-containing protein
VEKRYDLAFLKDYFDDDMEGIVPVLEMYLEETPKELSSIEQSLQNQDTTGAKAVTHKIKTNVAMLGIQDVGTFINDIHALQATDEIDNLIIEQFEYFRQAVMAALNQIRDDFFQK